MKVLFASSEAQPLAKTGGLADVSAALPHGLRELGHDVRILLPGYSAVLDQLNTTTEIGKLILVDGFSGSLLRSAMPDSGVPVYVLRAPALFERSGGLYQDENGRDFTDNAQRFAALSKIGALLSSEMSPLPWQPEIAHFSDWQTGLAAAYLKIWERPCAPVVFTIHNLSFTGSFPASLVPRLELPWDAYRIYGLEFYNSLSFLKAGLYYSDKIATVSPTYAAEIQTPEFGCGLDGLLRARSRDLHGIVNGIDTEVWNPATDRHLACLYDIDSVEAGKTANKAALQARLGLMNSPETPVFGIVSRLTYQKGVDLIHDSLIDGHPNLQVAILGSGDTQTEGNIRALARKFPGRVGVEFGYDEPLAHLIEAGSDFFLMPSRFEPCGLNQMYSMHYGTLPIVRRTGGLADTVTDEADGATSEATGFVFDVPKAPALSDAIDRALSVFAAPTQLRQMRRRAMQSDFGWATGAKVYESIYRDLLTAVGIKA